MPFIVLQLIFTYAVCSLTLYQVFCQLLNCSGESKKRMLGYCIGLGPISLSWLLIMLYLAFPGHGNVFYIIIINSLFIIPFLLLRKNLADLPALVRDSMRDHKQDFLNDKFAYIILLLGLSLVVMSFLLAIFLPYSENDALEYAMLAKVMFNEHSARMYPIVDGSQFGGFIAPFTHPLGYVGTFIWSYLIQGTAEEFGLIKIVAPFYAFCIYLLIINVLSPAGKRFAYLAGLLFIATPLILNGIVRHQIDPLRFYTFFVFFIFLRELTITQKWQIVIPAGIMLGLCLFSHSIGILAIPIFGFIYLFFSREKLSLIIKKITLVILIGFCFVAVRYAISLQTIGYLIHDGSIVRTVPSLHFYEMYELINGIYTNSQKWTNGFFKIFYNTLYFGIGYLSLLLCLFFIRKKNIKNLFIEGISSKNSVNQVLVISTLTVACFFGMVILSILIKNDNFIASNRYMMSVQPFVAILGAWAIIKLSETVRFNQRLLSSLSSLVIFVLALSFPLNNMLGYRLSPATLFDTNEAKAKHVQETYNLLAFYRKLASPDEKLLSFRNAEAAYYAGDQYIFHTDQKMLPIYTAKNKDEAYRSLHNLGIRYLAVPNYPLAYIDESYISDLLGDPAYCELVYQFGGSKLYKLNREIQDFSAQPITIVNNDFSKFDENKQILNWLFIKDYFSSRLSTGLKNGIHITNASAVSQKAAIVSGSKIRGEMNGSFIHYLRGQQTGDVELKPGGTYQLSTDVKGYGNLLFFLAKYDKNGYVGLQKIWQSALLKKQITKKNIQFKTTDFASSYRLVFMLDGAGWVNINDIELKEISYDEKQQTSNQKRYLIEMGWQVKSPNQLLSYIAKLKQKFGVGSTHHYAVENWQAYLDGDALVLSLSPEDSIKYIINSPIMPYTPGENINGFHFALSGKGVANIGVVSHSFQGQEYNIFKKSIPLTHDYQPIDIDLSSEVFEQLININADISGYQLFISYSKPSYNEPGNINVKL